MSVVLAFVVLEESDTTPINLTLTAIYRVEADADLFILNTPSKNLIKRQMMMTDEQMIMLEATADFHLPMNFCFI